MRACGKWKPEERAQGRSTLLAIARAVFAAAIDAEMWDGPNPIDRVKPRRVQQKIYETLRTHEVPRVLEAAGPWRDMTAVALYLGLRKGELFALRKPMCGSRIACSTCAVPTHGTL